MRFQLGWESGPGVLIDLHCIDDVFMLRYEGPLRSTLRRGVHPLAITPDDLDERVRGLRKLAAEAGLGGSRGMGVGIAGSDAPARLADEGESLFNLVLPQVVAADLGGSPLFVELGTDEALLPVPWELMRDAVGFIALRHAVGRYVNINQQPDLNQKPRTDGELNVLLVSVSKPQPIGDRTFEALPEADAEFRAISELLVDRGITFVALQGNKATKEAVRREIHGDRPYTVVHFTGHGHHDSQDARKSGLVLFDGILTTGVLSQFLRHAPILAFINGCETARIDDTKPVAASEGAELDVTELTRVFGIARPFLHKGSYVLGARWRVNDKSAATFAKAFYESLLEGAPIGRAISTARTAAFDQASADLSWASYVFYGDPRLKIALDPPAAMEPSATTAEPQVPVGPPADPALPPPPSSSSDVTAAVLPAVVEVAAEEYEEVRRSQRSSNRRTLSMEKVLDTVRAFAPGADAGLAAQCMGSDREGVRIVGVALAQSRPSASAVPLLLELVRHPASSFEQYHALVALREATPFINRESAVAVKDFLLDLLTDERFLNTGRAVVAREILPRVERQLASSSGNPSIDDL